MTTGIILILLLGHFSGQLASRCKAPPLIGMILCGIVIGPPVLNLLPSEILGVADGFRTVAVTVILMKAGLGLDRDKLKQQGSVALRLGFLPGLCEAAVVAIAAVSLLGFSWPTALLLGCILGAESPAVIVPGMLKLKAQGWGVSKGIPDAILVGSALSDVLLLLLFSLLIADLAPAEVSTTLLAVSNPLLLPLQVVLQISLGVAMGWLLARLLPQLLVTQRWATGSLQYTLVATGFSLALVVGAKHLPIYSGYLATMAAGYFLIGQDAPLTRQLRQGFNGLWAIAQLFLFVLLGASIRLDVLEQSFLVGVLVLAIGTFLGRSIGWTLATAGSNWTAQERLFLLPGNSAKATVQAAVGAMPLALAIPGGDQILAISALSILITAPLGAWAIPTFAPRLLQRDEVDSTKVTIEQSITLLVAIDHSPQTATVLRKAAELARRNDIQGHSEVIVLYVFDRNDLDVEQQLQLQLSQALADIRHRFILASGPVPEAILTAAHTHHADEIILGRCNRLAPDRLAIGSICQAVLETSPIPVVTVPTVRPDQTRKAQIG